MLRRPLSLALVFWAWYALAGGTVGLAVSLLGRTAARRAGIAGLRHGLLAAAITLFLGLAGIGKPYLPALRNFARSGSVVLTISIAAVSAGGRGSAS